MSTLIQITDNYATVGISGTEYLVGDNIYITTDLMKATNNVATALTDLGSAGGVVGVVQIPPDISVTGSRMVLRVDDDTLLAPIMRLLQARQL